MRFAPDPGGRQQEDTSRKWNGTEGRYREKRLTFVCMTKSWIRPFYNSKQRLTLLPNPNIENFYSPENGRNNNELKKQYK